MIQLDGCYTKHNVMKVSGEQTQDSMLVLENVVVYAMMPP